MRRKFVLILTLLILFLSGCKMILNTEVYLSDLLSLKDGKSNTIFVTAVLKIEIGSRDTYNENRKKLISMVQKYFGKVIETKYEESNLESYFVAEIEIPLVKDKVLNDRIFYLSMDKNGKKLRLNYNRNLFNQLNDQISREFFQTISFEDFSFSLTLINDQRQDVKITSQSIYVNDKPYPFKQVIPIKGRSKITIRLSDVLRDYIEMNNSSEILEMN